MKQILYRIKDSNHNSYYQSSSQGRNAGWHYIGEFFDIDTLKRMIPNALNSGDYGPGTKYNVVKKAYEKCKQQPRNIEIVEYDIDDDKFNAHNFSEFISEYVLKKHIAKIDPMDVVKRRIDNNNLGTLNEKV
jgi:hypothetical protein